jgi:hypothetical protein
MKAARERDGGAAVGVEDPDPRHALAVLRTLRALSDITYSISTAFD